MDDSRIGLLLQPPDTEGGSYGRGVAAANTLVFVGEPGRDVVDGTVLFENAGLVHVYNVLQP